MLKFQSANPEETRQAEMLDLLGLPVECEFHLQGNSALDLWLVVMNGRIIGQVHQMVNVQKPNEDIDDFELSNI